MGVSNALGWRCNSLLYGSAARARCLERVAAWQRYAVRDLQFSLAFESGWRTVCRALDNGVCSWSSHGDLCSLSFETLHRPNRIYY